MGSQIRCVVTFIAGAIVGALFVVCVFGPRPMIQGQRRTMNIEEYLAVRDDVYDLFSKMVDNIPERTRIENPVIALPIMKFPENTFVQSEAKDRQGFRHANSTCLTLALEDELINRYKEEKDHNLAGWIEDHYMNQLISLGFQKLTSAGGHHYRLRMGTEKRSRSIWISANGHIIVTTDTRAHLEAKIAEVDISILELY